MTLQEFKAWFEGYTEGMDGKSPSEKQWKAIKAKVSEITGTPITERIFIDRYWPQVFRPWSPPYYTWISQASGGLTGTVGYAQSNTADTAFNSNSAMYALGKAQALQ